MARGKVNGGFLALALAAGVMLPVQFSVNAQLRRSLGGPILAATVSFLVGTLALIAVALVARESLPSGSRIAHAPWWAWVGGFLGAFYVAVSIVVIPRVGAATTVALVVTGQMISALVLDQFGFLNVPVHKASVLRLLGTALVVAGVVLIQKF
jgi:transporter family-2 protein